MSPATVCSQPRSRSTSGTISRSRASSARAAFLSSNTIARSPSRLRRRSKKRGTARGSSAIGAALRRAGFTPSRYHADPVLGENRPFADEENGVHYFDNLAVLRSARIPALLFEAGVIVHREEELRMRDPAVRARIASGVVEAVASCVERSSWKSAR
ncbi:MAG: N-acetylmuramoyl-L-alanine amidase [Betaproteobacteria bacterium]|nr:N-acetylmuramoyl-L-alanine amidase [Betaproteobacteria bacterium]